MPPGVFGLKIDVTDSNRKLPDLDDILSNASVIESHHGQVLISPKLRNLADTAYNSLCVLTNHGHILEVNWVTLFG